MPDPGAPGDRRFPWTAAVLPGSLAVTVHRNDVEGHPCWTYVTDGLRHHRQPELALTLVRLPAEEPAAFPNAPLELFAMVHQFATQGRVVGAGELTEFGETGFLGDPRLRALAYTAPQAVPDVTPPGPLLTTLLLFDEERQVARACGLSRVLSRLGRATAHWPFPPWTDRARAPVAAAGEVAQSILERIPRMFVGGATTLQLEGRVELSLPRHRAAQFAAELPGLPPNVPLALHTALDPRATGWLVWHPGQQAPAAITPPGGEADRLCGCWCAFVPEQPADGAQLFEDGFVVMLTDATWARVRAALAASAPLDLPAAAPGGAFRLRWV